MPEEIKQSVLTVRPNDSAPVGNEDLRLIHLSRTVRHRNPNFFRQLAYVLDVSEAEAAAYWNGPKWILSDRERLQPTHLELSVRKL
jgi:hypothetical protein